MEWTKERTARLIELYEVCKKKRTMVVRSDLLVATEQSFFKTLLFLKDKKVLRRSAEGSFSQKYPRQDFLESQDCNNSRLIEVSTA
ncbi:hypothetical protein ANTPLA_LOCUS1710 [Anthophora plagiata]